MRIVQVPNITPNLLYVPNKPIVKSKAKPGFQEILNKAIKAQSSVFEPRR